eukprot:329729-Chlamydomonas_euryale.AAC.1
MVTVNFKQNARRSGWEVGLHSTPRVQPASRTKHPRKGKACGVGRRKLAARSLGAHGMCTMSGRGACQSSWLRQVMGASRQRAEAHQSSTAP